MTKYTSMVLKQEQLAHSCGPNMLVGIYEKNH